MEHGHHRKQAVVVMDPEAIAGACTPGVKERGAVAIEDPLGVTSGTLKFDIQVIRLIRHDMT